MPRRKIRGRSVSKKLTRDQEKFLKYLMKEHKGIGWLITIELILRSGQYNSKEINWILERWERMVMGNVNFVQKYGTPKQYRKIHE